MNEVDKISADYLWPQLLGMTPNIAVHPDLRYFGGLCLNIGPYSLQTPDYGYFFTVLISFLLKGLKFNF